MLTTFLRLSKTAKNHISRNGWLSIAATAIMTLTFIVISVFVSLAYTANSLIKYAETQYPLYVFFDPSLTNTQFIDTLRNQLDATGMVKDIKYTSQSQAYNNYKDFLSKENPILSEGVNESVLPSSIEIQANSLSQLDKLDAYLNTLKSSDKQIDRILYYSDAVNNLNQAISVIKIIGISLIIFLIGVSFLIVLITIGITINSHKTEIEIMQLVGASRNYIRLPYILDGAFYGVVGVICSFTLICLVIFVILKVHPHLLTDYLLFFSSAKLPDFSKHIIILGLLIEVAVGAVLGMVGSVIALIKYLK